MAQFLRGKQAGIQKDLSEGLSPDLFLLDDFARCGVNSQISAIAYNPVQSLIAVGTSDTSFGSGQIYVFGQRRVSVVFEFPRKASARFLQFCADKLVSIDSKNQICVYSLETGRMVVSYAPPGQVTALLTDPSLDYAFIGLQNGEIIAYDLDRESLTPFRVPNLWLERNPRARFFPVVSLEFSPRDIGKILVGYPEGAVTFTFKQNIAQKFFVYEIPPGAPGGDCLPSQDVRRPKLKKAIWHPNGIFILTIHEDSSLVLWDTKDGRKLHARTVQTPNVDQPGAGRPGSPGDDTGPKEPITNAIWCAKDNTDETGLLVAGGRPPGNQTKGLVFLDMGPTPNYQTSSWQILSTYLERPRRQMNLSVPPGAKVVDFCLIPRSSPYFNGAHDPIALLAILSSGEIISLSFPSGHAITPTNMLHPFLTFVHPFVNKAVLTPVDRSVWLGLRERRLQGPRFAVGGKEAKNPLKRFENRNIISTAHADGTVRIWDCGHDDEIENGDVVQVDLARAIGRVSSIEVTEMSLASGSGEMSIGLKTGELAIFRWGNNSSYGREDPPGANQGPGKLTPITQRTDPGLKTGMLPLTLLDMQQGPVTALKHGQVGFVAAGYQGGALVIIDLRGPAIIHTAHLSEILKAHKRSGFRKSRMSEENQAEWATQIEFGVMTLDGEDYSSICCFVGTSRGNVATFKILPASNGTYEAAFVGSSSVEDAVINIIPIDADSGGLALATPSAVGGLRTGVKVNGVVIAVTASGCRMFKPPTAKGAHKSWEDYLCDSAAVVKTEGRGYSLVGLFGDGNARAFSIPALRDIGCAKISHIAEMRRLSEACITPTGNIMTWVGPSEIGLFNVWGSGNGLYVFPTNSPYHKADAACRHPSKDKLFNPEAVLPPRPTITNMQWISGTQYISPADMDILIGGPERPPSKRMLEQMKFEDEERRKALREGRAPPPPQQSGSQEGYWSYMSRQVQERTERLGIVGDSMDRLEENSSGFANDVGKYVQSQKKKAVLGLLGSKFGL
ncbi:Lethal giant larvae (Lgl)-like C-terminal [Penicillium paradoxum]|uniref:Lethal giant larvae (Lgl)-like C-terminal n=1 Tax=Penicillium paradoxum TaxID=176176 RepID=UPI0025490F27|nr:Lethal giant larvae (Lgl)-like C-terminal [Penicillium paradoxum]KAJ5793648.1 Lethal giant larvae (Lgl)-like C-terminal [Penicillium paradoxum]